MYKLLKKSKKSEARLGLLHTAHGKVSTPFFMPIATKATIKGLTVEEVKELGAEIILSNTYHNYLKPGVKIFKKFKGFLKDQFNIIMTEFIICSQYHCIELIWMKN